jgi:hypothetical protein
MTAALAVHATTTRQLPLIIGLLVALVVVAWLLRGFYLMHKLVRVDTLWTKNTLRSWLKRQFPHWPLQELTPQLWRLSGIYSQQQLYVFVTPKAVYLGLVSLGRGYLPTPFKGADNFKQLQQLRRAIEKEQDDRAK